MQTEKQTANNPSVTVDFETGSSMQPQSEEDAYLCNITKLDSEINELVNFKEQMTLEGAINCEKLYICFCTEIEAAYIDRTLADSTSIEGKEPLAPSSPCDTLSSCFIGKDLDI